MQRSLIVCLLLAALLAGCVELGPRFGPGLSMREVSPYGSLFAEPPVVERRGQEYVLTWRQGT